MRGYKCFLSIAAILGIFIPVMQVQSLERLRRATPVVTEIYAMDHFIELVEKVEESNSDLWVAADYIRSLVFNDDYWTAVIGPPSTLPNGVLTQTEKNTLTNMLRHQYVGSREMGVVLATRGETIAVGYLVTGIMAGIRRNNNLLLTNYVSGASKTVDNLYAATISRIMAETALAKKNTPSNTLYGPAGSWDNTECPEVYTRNDSSISKASYAQILGAVDGFLMGYQITKWARNVRLGQLLRMYYSNGVCFDNSYASCKRHSTLTSVLEKDDSHLWQQVEGVAEALYLKNTASYPNVANGDIEQISKDVAGQFVATVGSVSSSTACPPSKEPGCELPANLVFLMDESGSISTNPFKDEKKFVRDIIDAFNISPRQTKVAVVEFGTTANIDMGLDLYGSKTRLQCAVKRITQQLGFTNTAAALDLARTQIFLPLQNVPASPAQSDRTNIVILLTDGKANRPTVNAIYPAITRIKAQVKDLTMFAVGVGSFDRDQLNSIATNSSKHVITSSNFNELLNHVKELQNQTCHTPVELDLNFKVDGNTSYVEAFVSPFRARYFVLPSSLFFGSSILLKITPTYGKIRLFGSRRHQVPSEENHDFKLDPIPNGQSLQYYSANPCGGAYNASMCAPLYLTIQHADSVQCSCTEKRCFLPGQIKFRIEKGVRVPSSSTINKPTSLVWMVFFAILTILLWQQR